MNSFVDVTWPKFKFMLKSSRRKSIFSYPDQEVHLDKIH